MAKNNIEESIDKIQLLTFNTITSLTELNKELKAFKANYSMDDMIVSLWNKGLNRNQITRRLGVSYNTVSRHIDNLKVKGVIKERGRA